MNICGTILPAITTTRSVYPAWPTENIEMFEWNTKFSGQAKIKKSKKVELFGQNDTVMPVETATGGYANAFYICRSCSSIWNYGCRRTLPPISDLSFKLLLNHLHAMVLLCHAESATSVRAVQSLGTAISCSSMNSNAVIRVMAGVILDRPGVNVNAMISDQLHSFSMSQSSARHYGKFLQSFNDYYTKIWVERYKTYANGPGRHVSANTTMMCHV